LFYARTENLIHETFSNEATFLEWGTKRREYVDSIARYCSDIFDELTRPYAVKPELVPVIAWSRRRLIAGIVKLKEES
jgi:CRISPR system Cascade subunit CasA